MTLMELVYEQCGINLGDIPNDKRINCNRVWINQETENKILDLIAEHFPKLSTTRILLLLLNYGPMVDPEQKEDIIVMDNYLIPETKTGGGSSDVC